MRNPLAWTFLVVGVIVGAVIGGIAGPTVTSSATAKARMAIDPPEALLPFHLTPASCKSPDCIGTVVLPNDVESPKPLTRAPKPGPSILTIPSNMSVNGGGDAELTPGPIPLAGKKFKTGPSFAITIPEQLNDGFPKRRMQTLYVNAKTTGGTSGRDKQYTIVTCYYSDARKCP